uniref:NADH dehydrogenase subunit 1 n=1 Tax=Ophioleila elegans TaxID=1815333 RepID=UPI0023F488C1|nr:NADH dehydrogenase subunit 1 [Ophioleila elegans]WED07075.1 NADH dehydrogenase subunit 1 [Ophioleila elegans]
MSFFFYYIIFLVNIFGLLIPVLLAVALLTLFERKVIGYMQFRKGPNLVGPIGVLQPIADGLKLFIKENIKPFSALPLLFFLAPAAFFFIALFLWVCIPVLVSGINLSLSLLFILTLSSLSVYPVLSAGWASNSKYALLGAVRGVAQTISYEVSFGLIVLPIVLLVGGWGLSNIYSAQESFWLVLPCFPLFIMWYISMLAETNRAPFDLTEGESELVSGYNVEYSGAPFALFFIGEYANIILMSLLICLLFLGNTFLITFFLINIFALVVECLFFIFSFLWVRSSFPRIRYDQLMMLMWKGLLPISLSFFLFYYVTIFVFLGVPPFFL